MRPSEVLHGAPGLALELAENISAHHLRKVLGCGLLYKGPFRRLLLMNDNKSAVEFKVSLTVAKEDPHFATSSLLLQPSTPAINLLMFSHIPHFWGNVRKEHRGK